MDKQLEEFILKGLDEALAVADASDVFALEPGPGAVPDRFRARFFARGLVRRGNGPVTVAEECTVQFTMDDEYLWHAHPLRVVSWIGPTDVFHPNAVPVGSRVVLCTGPLRAATDLMALCTHLYGMWTWDIATLNEFNCLNRAAVQWGRRNRAKLPIDDRPIVWRAPVTEVA